MKKNIRTALIVMAVSPFLIQCARMSDVEDVRRQLTAVNKKIELVKSTTVDEMQKRQAAAFNQMDQLEEQMAELRNQLDDSYQLNQRLREQNKELQQSISTVAQNGAKERQRAFQEMQQQNQEKAATIDALNRKLNEQEQLVEAIRQARLAEAQRKAAEASRKAQEARKKSSRSTASSSVSSHPRHLIATKQKVKKDVIAPPVRQASGSATPHTVKHNQPSKVTASQTSKTSLAQAAQTSSAQFIRAKQLAEKNRCNEAIPILSEIRKDRRAKDGVDATFLIAECYLKKEQLYDAINEYQRIIAQYPQDPRVPDAMLKLGRNFEKVGDKPTARTIYNKLLREYGSSPEATTAQERLNKL